MLKIELIYPIIRNQGTTVIISITFLKFLQRVDIKFKKKCFIFVLLKILKKLQTEATEINFTYASKYSMIYHSNIIFHSISISIFGKPNQNVYYSYPALFEMIHEFLPLVEKKNSCCCMVTHQKCKVIFFY